MHNYAKTDFSLPEGPFVDEKITIELEPEKPHWSELFKHDQYDWNDPEFVERNRGPFAYRPLLLSKGYFAAVSIHTYELLTRFLDGSPKRWHANVQLHRDDPDGHVLRVYAVRSGRKRLGEPANVFMHRELLNCIDSPKVVDHVNGWGLDNRSGTPENPVNLIHVKRGGNWQNSVIPRRKNHDLHFQGTEKKPGGRFGGKVCKRIGKSDRVLTIRSKETWATEEEAYQWYKEQLKVLNEGRGGWAHDPTSVSWPEFPPLLESEISSSSKRLRQETQPGTEDTIPF